MPVPKANNPAQGNPCHYKHSTRNGFVTVINYNDKTFKKHEGSQAKFSTNKEIYTPSEFSPSFGSSVFFNF